MLSFQNNMNTGDIYRFDCIFCGAGFAAAGAAAKLADSGKRVLLLDPCGSPGSEYALALYGGTLPVGTAQLAADDEPVQELCRRGAVTADGWIEPTALAPVLCHILMSRADKISYFPSSVPVAAEKTADGWRVDFVTNGIRHTAVAARLVSADLYDLLGGTAAEHIKSKRLIGIADSRDGISGDIDLGDGCRACRGASCHDVTVTFEFSPDTDMRTARLDVLGRIENGLFDGTDIRIAALGEEFAVISDEKSTVRSNGYARLAPVAHGDAVSAYGDGVLFAAMLEKPDGGEFVPSRSISDAADGGRYDLIVAGLGAALALAVRGETDAARDAIIGMIRDRSGEMPYSSHTFCLPYAVSAMSAAGKCGMSGALPALLDVVCDPDYAVGIPNLDTVDDKTKLICDDDDVKYLYFAAALGAVRDIFRKHPDDVRRAIACRIKPELSRYVTGASMIGRTDGVRNDSKNMMRRIIDEIWG